MKHACCHSTRSKPEHLLNDIPDVCVKGDIGRPYRAHHLYVLQIDFEKIGVSRAQFMIALREKGVGSQVHYIPVPAQPYYISQGYNLANYPNAERYYSQALSIPIYYSLSESEQKKVIGTIFELVG